MQEQNFEQQVRQKMEELSLEPSQPVWQKVEEQIRKKKDKRFIFLWILPLVLLLMGIMWWSKSENEKPETIVNKKISTDNSVFEQKVSDKKTQKIETTNKLENTGIEDNTNINTKAEKLAQDNTKLINTRTYVKEANSQTENLIKNSIAHNSFSDSFNPKNSTQATLSKTQSQSTPDSIDENQQIGTVLKTDKDVIKKTHNSINTAEIINPIKAETENVVVKKNKEENDTAQALKHPNTKKKSNKFQFSIVGQVGFSGITTGLLDGFGQKSAQDFSGVYPNQSNPGTIPTSSPSNINRGLSYAIGFSIQKKINPRSSISSGVQYQYYSTRIAVGTLRPRDSILSNVSRDAASYYRNDISSKNYSNQFHFITLPVSYKYQLFKKFPLQIGAGVSLSQLVSTNALHYNSAADIYYKDNSLFHKTQLGLISNLTFKLLRKNKISLDVGPQLNYGITPLQKNSGSQKQHLFSIGINTNVNF